MVVIANSKDRIPPILQQLVDDPKKHRLVDDFKYIHRNSFSIYIRAGFVTDGATIPRFLWTICGSPFTGTYTVPAILHDALYSIEAYKTNTVSEYTARLECDRAFHEAMQDWGSGWITRNILYSGVRSGGWVAWNNHTERSIKLAKEYITIN